MRIARTLALILLLVLMAAVVPVAAQEEEPDDDGSLPSFEHPVVTLLGSYFEVETDVLADYRQQQEIGFGVLVKLYAVASEFGVPLEELVALLQSGTGMGELFQEYGRPSVFAPGHLKGKGGGAPSQVGRPQGS